METESKIRKVQMVLSKIVHVIGGIFAVASLVWLIASFLKVKFVIDLISSHYPWSYIPVALIMAIIIVIIASLLMGYNLREIKNIIQIIEDASYGMLVFLLVSQQYLILSAALLVICVFLFLPDSFLRILTRKTRR